MSRNDYRMADDGRDNLDLWERCRLIVERGIKKYGNAGSLPISGTGRSRKKGVDGPATSYTLGVPTRKKANENSKRSNRNDDHRKRGGLGPGS